MKLTRTFSAVRMATPEAKVDEQGGLIPTDKEKAKAADLITLPEGVTGTNCQNCKFIKNGYCTHPKVRMPVNDRNCCALWDAEGTLRHFKFDRNEEILSGSTITTEVG